MATKKKMVPLILTKIFTAANFWGIAYRTSHLKLWALELHVSTA